MTKNSDEAMSRFLPRVRSEKIRRLVSWLDGWCTARGLERDITTNGSRPDCVSYRSGGAGSIYYSISKGFTTNWPRLALTPELIQAREHAREIGRSLGCKASQLWVRSEENHKDWTIVELCELCEAAYQVILCGRLK